MSTNFSSSPLNVRPARHQILLTALLVSCSLLSTALVRANTYTLGTSLLLEGPAAGSDSVVLAVQPTTGGWTASANASWLHLGVANQSGSGSTNVVFSFDPNPGSTRTGTLTIGDQTLTVTQAGFNYVPAEPLTSLISGAWSANSLMHGIGVDAAGNVYIPDSANNVIKMWSAANSNMVTLPIPGLSSPSGVAVDVGGNVYVADTSNNAVKLWTAANSNLTTLVSNGLAGPNCVALDNLGNVYIADTGNSAIKEWTAATGNVTTLVSNGLSSPYAVAVDIAGNVYIADTRNNAIKEWTVANSNLTTLASSALYGPYGLAVDGAGNVYFENTLGPITIQKWVAASNVVVTLVGSGLDYPWGVTVDASGNVFIADTGPDVLRELPFAYVDPTPRQEGNSAGNDVLPAVLPATENLLAQFVPVSDQPWLTITGVTNGVVSFAYTANTGQARTAHITLLNQSIPITQGHFSLGASSLVEGPQAGSDSMVLAVTPHTVGWAVTANAPWLHVNPATQSGTGSTNVIFSFDVNSGPTRTGTLSIGDQVLTITQAGSTYVPAGVITPLISSGLAHASGITVDILGNVYVAESLGNTAHNALKEWTITNNTVITLVSNGMAMPTGLAADTAGNIYIADGSAGSIFRWTAASSNLTTLYSDGFNAPLNVAVDAAGTRVYITDTDNSVIREQIIGNNSSTVLVSGSALHMPKGAAVDTAGNVYIANSVFTDILKWTAANGAISIPAASLTYEPVSIAVDGSGNFYFADGSGAIVKWTYVNTNLTTLITPAQTIATGVAVDAAENVYVVDTLNNVVKELPRAFVDPTTKMEGADAGSDALPSVLPPAENLLAPFAPTSDQSWLSISGASNGVVGFAFIANLGPIRTAHIGLLGQTVSVIQSAGPYLLGSTSLLAGPLVGTNSVVLTGNSQTAVWTAVANVPWLHVSVASQSGIGGTNIIFSFDANPGPTRTGTFTIASQTFTVTQAGPSFVLGTTALVLGPLGGTNSVVLAVNPNYGNWTAITNASWLHVNPGTQSGNAGTNVVFNCDTNFGSTRVGTLTIAGQTLTIIQAGTNYIAAGNVPPLVSSNLSSPVGVAVDGFGNVYIADNSNNVIKQWSISSNTVTTLVASGLSKPSGVAVDGVGNLYIADTGNNSIQQWTATNGILTALITGLNQPRGVALDSAGNVYAADTGNNAIVVWTATNNSVTTLVSGLNQPGGVAVDAAGNVYIADTGNNAVEEWQIAGNTVSTLVSSGLNGPTGVAVDGQGNVYVADVGDNAIKQWVAATHFLVPFSSQSFSAPAGVAVDRSGNVYIADTGDNLVRELPDAFLVTTAKFEGANGGSDALMTVLPATLSLAGPLTPTSDQPWLTINGITNGVVSFSFTPDTGTNRTANITLLGQTIPVTQAGPVYSINTATKLIGPAAGSNVVLLTVSPSIGPWTASANDAWLHLSPANQGGTGTTNVIFSFDANPGPTRTGTITLAGMTISVTQAGATYTPAGLVTLVSSGLNQPYGVAVDGVGNVYIADTVNSTLKEWLSTNNTVSSSLNAGFGLSNPYGVALDTVGNVYVADTFHSMVKKLTLTNQTVSTLVSLGSLNNPRGVAIDSTGNVYIADTRDNAIKKWTVATRLVSTVLSTGLAGPDGVSLDGMGNLYVVDTLNNAIKKWVGPTNAVVTLISSGLNRPAGLATDAPGNVYIADASNNVIKVWSVANNNLTTLVSSGLNQPAGVAVDSAGDVFIADTQNNAIKELPNAFVDATAKSEPAAAGTDTLPAVLPAVPTLRAPFSPTSDQPWLTISGTTNGVVSFSFTANTNFFTRAANITLLGQTVPVSQAAAVAPPVLIGGVILPNGTFQFSFSNNQGVSFTVLTSTNIETPLSSWAVAGTATNLGSGLFRFTTQPTTNDFQRYFRVRTP